MSAGRMGEVELVDEPDGLAPGDLADRSRAVRRSRLLRVLRRWWPLAAGIVTAVVVAQVVADRQQRAEVEHRRETDGVLQVTVTPPLAATPWESTEVSGLSQTGFRTPDGMLAGVVLPTSVGAPALVVVDPATGVEQWRVDVGEASPGSGLGSCSLVAEPAATVWCLLYEPASRDGDAVVLAPTVVEVGLAERAVLGSRDLAPEADGVVVGSTLVVATPGPAGLEVEATDLVSGDVLWSQELDGAPSADGTGGFGVRAAGDHVLVSGADGTWVLDAAAGGAVQVSGDAVTTRVGRVAVTQGSTSTALLDAASGTEDEIRGLPLPVEPDDGTAPDVLFVQRYDGTADGVLAAVDVTTGETLWQRDGSWDANGRLVVLDGVLYGAGGAAVWAVDALTGEERWSAPAGVGERSLFTDGRSLLLTEHDTTTGGVALAAFDLGDGRRAWTASLPEGIGSVWAHAGTLFGWSTDVATVASLG